MKLREEVKRKQGLAALAFGKFAEEYEIEEGRRLEVGSTPDGGCVGGRCRRLVASLVGGRCRRLVASLVGGRS